MDPNQERQTRKTIDYYNKSSEQYDRGYSTYLKNTHRQLLERLKLSPGARVLDVSGGTGILAEQIITRHKQVEVVLNDPSGGMLDIAKKRLNNHKNVRFTDHLAEELPFSEQSFNHVVCLNSFHYYTDQQKVIRKFYEILKPGGLLYLLDWNRESWFRLPNAVISFFSPEHINTRSFDESLEMLTRADFNITYQNRWTFRFWKFFLIEASK